MKRILNFFLQGLLYTIPIVVTIFVLYQLFIWVDKPISDLFEKNLNLNIPGVGVITTIILITFFGFIGSYVVATPIWNFIEKGLIRTPLVKIIYTGVKDMIAAFLGEKKRFNHPVLVIVNRELSIQRIGFITQNDLSELGLGKDKVAVYMPFSYSFSGVVVICPSENITPIDASGSEMMKFVISGGVTEVQ
jgi:uncharacterized membrane protein